MAFEMILRVEDHHYRYRLLVTHKSLYEQRKEARDWCAEIFGPEGKRWRYHYCSFLFHEESDAAMFKIRWYPT